MGVLVIALTLQILGCLGQLITSFKIIKSCQKNVSGNNIRCSVGALTLHILKLDIKKTALVPFKRFPSIFTTVGLSRSQGKRTIT